LDDVHVFTIPAEAAKYLKDGPPHFGADVADKFPGDATYEIAESAKCLALERSTASAFHSIRCLEAGIRAMARCLGIPDPMRANERTWGKALESIEKEIKRRWPYANNRMSGDGQTFDELYATLAAIQNPYRNVTMHLEAKYTSEEAEHIFAMVKGLMTRIASRMDENGEPRLP
jgi:hypothetical protein